MTADQVAELAAGGRFWWLRGEDFVTSSTPDPLVAGDVYLLEASPEWLAQWAGDWQAAADYLTPLLARLEGDA